MYTAGVVANFDEATKVLALGTCSMVLFEEGSSNSVVLLFSRTHFKLEMVCNHCLKMVKVDPCDYYLLSGLRSRMPLPVVVEMIENLNVGVNKVTVYNIAQRVHH